MSELPFTIEVHPDRDAWLKARHSMGSSDAAVAAGCGFDSPFVWWAKKSGKVPDEVSPQMERRFRFGHYAEPFIMHEAEAALGRPFLDPGDYTIFRPKADPWRHSTPDRLVKNSEARVLFLESDAVPSSLLEFMFQAGSIVGPASLKTVGIGTRDRWTDQPDEYAYVQIQHELDVLGLEVAWVCPLFGAGEDFALYEVVANRTFQDELREREEALWRHVVEDRAPEVDATADAKRVLAMVYAEADPAKVIRLPADPWLELHARRLELKELKRAAEQELDGIENRLRAAMGDAVRAEIDGLEDRAYTWKPQTRKAYVVEESTSRVLRDVKR